MELVKKRIHIQQNKSKAVLQVPIEEDINVPDKNPDVTKVILDDGKIKIDEIKTGINRIWVKGKLLYKILYQSDEKVTKLSEMEGETQFMEEISMDNIETTDRVVCDTKLEDMRVNMINSRKLSIQAVISLMPYVEESVDEEICTDIEGNEDGVEYRKKELPYLDSIVNKRDLLRIHEECKLPAGMPNIGGVIWKTVRISQVNYRPLDGKISVNGVITLFMMYEEDTKEKINWYETTIPFSGNIDCADSRDNMIPNIKYETGHEDISVREDADGETRIIAVEETLEMEIKLSSQQTATVVTDVYGINSEIDAITKKCDVSYLFQDVCIEEKYSSIVKLEPSDSSVVQICHQDAEIEVNDIKLLNNSIEIIGNINIRILYISDNEDSRYELIDVSYPVEMTRQIPGVDTNMECELNPKVQQIQASIKDANQIEWRCLVELCVKIISKRTEDILTNVKVSELNTEKVEQIPGFAIYFVQEGDSLWQIGKKYLVSVDNIKTVNDLSGDEIKAGDKLLIVKSGQIN